MKNSVQLIMFLCLTSLVSNVFANPREKTFEGEWASHDHNIDFGIHLDQNGNRLTGYHSAVTKDASRTDTAPDGEGSPSIMGQIKGDTAIVTIRSAYSGALVKAQLTLKGRDLEWKIIEVKEEGMYYFPEKATLHRVHWDTKKGWVRDTD
jgi:hypothetical protein